MHPQTPSQTGNSDPSQLQARLPVLQRQPAAGSQLSVRFQQPILTPRRQLHNEIPGMFYV
ncbi:hypothetical protein AGABI1DRAFT_132564 [Agaricus bisporus var. burnettii JB137-S8]|uniref:Uncharacterized protein n=1 Tax=Agaricus bisporus var. burnettii (strain JB137-S8 / ATCC MYA-4627 / FGSC 10392) TaxID=597362 RepID=K5VL74_AGABU|nr:uncharacterized protein AGABI1DRAFT_132564 [Agaricus bisporus var. burnettii JB137-S8]EKM75114.1 hypothetical protein AGABI1DRAFT_132564 [Agaricus bisporus var. burnettii JB137-S8]